MKRCRVQTQVALVKRRFIAVQLYTRHFWGSANPYFQSSSLVRKVGELTAAGGVLHRDIKPENIMMQRTLCVQGDPYSMLRLGDFGDNLHL
eukprot:1008863-Pyramimonas_sp.AAC.1